MRAIVLYTAEFPFGKGETFLETEIKYLAKAFDKVYIVATESVDLSSKRETPSNCEISICPIACTGFEKLVSVSNMVAPIFKNEKKRIEQVYKIQIKKGIRNTLLLSISRAKKIKAHLHSLKGIDKDLGVAYSYWCNDVSLGLAMYSEEYRDVKTCSRVHGWDLYFEASSVNYLPYRKFITQHLDRLFSISQKGIDYIQETWKVDSTNVELARLGVNSLGKIEGKHNPILVSCSNLIPLKRVDLIARVVAKIDTPGFKWVHFGDGPQMENIIKILADLKVSPDKFELKGRVPNQEVLQWYLQHKPLLFINLSTSEGIPVSIMEAMSCGIPVIATNVGGTAEIVSDEVGRLIESTTTEQQIVKEVLAFFSKSENELKVIEEAAWRYFDENYSAEVNYGQFVENQLPG